MFQVGNGVRLTSSAKRMLIKDALKSKDSRMREGVVVYVKSAHDRNEELIKDSDSGGWVYNAPLVTFYNNKGEYAQFDGKWLKEDNSVLKRMDAKAILNSRKFEIGDKVRLTEKAKSERTFETTGNLLFDENTITEGRIIKIERSAGVPILTYQNEKGDRNSTSAIWLEKVPVIQNPENEKPAGVSV